MEQQLLHLYDCERGTRFKLGQQTNERGLRPPGDCTDVTDKVIRLNNLDGMYSHCTLEDGTVVHIAADALVIIVSKED